MNNQNKTQEPIKDKTFILFVTLTGLLMVSYVLFRTFNLYGFYQSITSTPTTQVFSSIFNFTADNFVLSVGVSNLWQIKVREDVIKIQKIYTYK